MGKSRENGVQQGAALSLGLDFIAKCLSPSCSQEACFKTPTPSFYYCFYNLFIRGGGQHCIYTAFGFQQGRAGCPALQLCERSPEWPCLHRGHGSRDHHLWWVFGLLLQRELCFPFTPHQEEELPSLSTHNL